MTIDKNKRKTLKILTASSAATAGVMAAPSLVHAACQHAGQTAAVETDVALRGTGLVISFSSRANISPTAGSRTVVITNTSNKPVTLTHVYPGIVDTGTARYDINSLLAKGPRVFEPNEPVLLQIEAVANHAIEKHIPAGLHYKSEVSINTLSPGVNGGQAVKTVRTLLS